MAETYSFPSQPLISAISVTHFVSDSSAWKSHFNKFSDFLVSLSAFVILFGFGQGRNVGIYLQLLGNLGLDENVLIHHDEIEGTFGIIKNDRWYKRIVRRGIKFVQLEVYLVSLGYNLYKFHNKQLKTKSAA